VDSAVNLDIRRLPLPSWGVNLAGFGLLIALVLAAFLWQLAVIDQDLHRSTLDRARMMAAVIEEHLTNANQAEVTIDAVTTTFLRDKARFVAYLHAIDPLQSEELTALAKETGLLGIALVRQDGQVVGGPAEWLTAQQDCTPAPDQLHYDREQQTALLLYPGDEAQIRCIRVGLDARAIVQLRDKTALPALLANLSRLPGIRYVRLDAAGQPPEHDPVRLLAENDVATAEARLATPMGLLTVGLDAVNHQNRLTQLRRQFILFAALLLGLGLFFSWLLYRYQQADLARTRSFERLLAKEHEAAALGRATATIAHEVRNPLNAINMGLQRLTLESAVLDEDQRALIVAMEEAVRRAAAIISELQRFTRKLQPRLQPLDPAELLQQMLLLYRQRSADQQITVSVNRQFEGTVQADPDLLAELLENLLKNSLEAQPEGGFVQIDLNPAPEGLEIAVTNGGCRLSAEDLARLGEPYFTTKTRGTGLGLALCRRIAEAHGGGLRIAADHRQGRLTVSLTLPRRAEPGTIPPTRTESGGTQ
jgi:signal transduction histidine kinase